MSDSARYTAVDSKKSQGATYTPAALAQFVALQMLECAPMPRDRPWRILDPAVGEGALAVALLDALRERDFGDVSFLGLDRDKDALRTCRTRLAAREYDYDVELRAADFLEVSAGGDVGTYDLVIANPPYVRTQILGAAEARALADRFGLGGRVDLYHAFLLAIADALAPGGVAGVIVSNSFMTTRAGATLRERLPQLMDLRAIWDLGDSKLFDAAVLPAVIVGTGRGAPPSNGDVEFTAMYSTSRPPTSEASDALAALAHDGVVALDDGRCFDVRHGVLETDGVWRLGTAAIRDWLAAVAAATHCTFGDLGKIRVGVKSTADAVFIREDWSSAPAGPPELLRPVVTHHVARRYRAEQPTRSILYPHDAVDGRCVAIDLADFPKSAAYLGEHRTRLESRKYLREAGRAWYELWVPQDPAAWARQKLVFRDISDRPTFWIDTSGAVVNGDCYWMMPTDSEDEDLLWLALAIANSTFCEAFYDLRFNNKLYANRRRFITQYVKHFPLPSPNTAEAQQAVASAKALFELGGEGSEAAAIEDELDTLVWSMFGLRRGSIENHQ